METIFSVIRYNWEMRYDAYIDDLILFSPRFGRSVDSERSFKREFNDMVVGLMDSRIEYLKIENASRYFDGEIGDLSKKDIINRIKEFTYA